MIYLLMPGQPSEQLEKMVGAALENKKYTSIQHTHQMPDLRNKKILFAVELGTMGFSIPLMEMMKELASRGEEALKGSTGALLIHSDTPLYTKSTAAHVIFFANQLGCSFIGHPLIEATEDLKNFMTWKKTMDLSLREISLELSKKLVDRLVAHQPPTRKKSRLVYLHSSFRVTSNTLTLWKMVESHLTHMEIQELYVENGAVFDCFGCSYRACYEFGKKKSCFYGGVMTEKIIPAIERADILVWICPNYNDSISSNLIAVINRLTTLYRQMNFYDKMFFSIIVSGNSGSDSIGRQLIDALNINKGFYLPPYFSLMETANDANSILKIPHIHEKAELFANHINQIGRGKEK